MGRGIGRYVGRFARHSSAMSPPARNWDQSVLGKLPTVNLSIVETHLLYSEKRLLPAKIVFGGKGAGLTEIESVAMTTIRYL
jgi:hypothetical protein